MAASINVKLTELSREDMKELKRLMGMKRGRGRPKKERTAEELAEKKRLEEEKAERKRLREESKKEKQGKPKRGRGRPRKVWTAEEIAEKKKLDEAKAERKRIREESKKEKRGRGSPRVEEIVKKKELCDGKELTAEKESKDVLVVKNEDVKVTEAIRRVMLELEVLIMELGY